MHPMGMTSLGTHLLGLGSEDSLQSVALVTEKLGVDTLGGSVTLTLGLLDTYKK